jgi:hypothetical protein
MTQSLDARRFGDPLVDPECSPCELCERLAIAFGCD